MRPNIETKTDKLPDKPPELKRQTAICSKNKLLIVSDTIKTYQNKNYIKPFIFCNKRPPVPSPEHIFSRFDIIFGDIRKTEFRTWLNTYGKQINTMEDVTILCVFRYGTLKTNSWCHYLVPEGKPQRHIMTLSEYNTCYVKGRVRSVEQPIDVDDIILSYEEDDDHYEVPRPLTRCERLAVMLNLKKIDSTQMGLAIGAGAVKAGVVVASAL